MAYRVAIDELEIRTLVTRLARPHASGGDVVERAAIMAAGTDATAVVSWIGANGGQPEMAPVAANRGLQSTSGDDPNAAASGPPRRYVLPVGLLH